MLKPSLSVSRALFLKQVLYALGAVSVAFLCALALETFLPATAWGRNERSIGLIFMLGCAFVAGRYGLLPALIASAVSFVVVNFYFDLDYPYEPINYDSNVNAVDVLNVGLFLASAIVISVFTSRMRERAQHAIYREESTKALFSLYRITSETFSREQALDKSKETLDAMLGVEVAFFLPLVLNPERIEAVTALPEALAEPDQRALEACWSESRTSERPAPFHFGATWWFKPMIASLGAMGVLGVRLKDKNQMDAWFGQLFGAVADQTASVLEHIELEGSMEKERIENEREKLRSMLLSSVSHDFKTPLAGVIGALSACRSLGSRLTVEKRDSLIESALEEAQRLDSFITNILDMTRLESGNIRFKSEWHDVSALVADVTQRLKYRLRNHAVVVQPLPPVEAKMDVTMTEQVLQNILDNACKYTPEGTRIEIRCEVGNGNGLTCQIRDYGAGLPPEKMERVFDKYARLHKRDSQVAGTGLGLSICKGVMEAQGGWIRAANHPEGGAVFTVGFPEWRPVRREDMDANEQAYRRN
jgi:two-component system sensor histidine kinase KdpD